MTFAADQQTGGVAPSGPLVDVSDVPMAKIFGSGSALAGALERVELEAQSIEAAIAAFGNFAPDDPPPTVAAPAA